MGHHGQKSIAAMKDVPTKYREEEFVSGTVHHCQNILAVTKVVPTMLRQEEFVEGTLLS